MAWTAPTTRTTGELITAAIWNTDIVDNLDALKDPASDYSVLDEASNYTTNVTSFADVDSTDLSRTITTTGSDVLVEFHGMVSIDTDVCGVQLNVSVDESNHAADDGIIGLHRAAGSIAAARIPISFTRLIPGLSAASHVFRLRWKVVGAATATMYVGAGTTSGDIHPQFWVREVS